MALDADIERGTQQLRQPLRAPHIMAQLGQLSIYDELKTLAEVSRQQIIDRAATLAIIHELREQAEILQ